MGSAAQQLLQNLLRLGSILAPDFDPGCARTSPCDVVNILLSFYNMSLFEKLVSNVFGIGIRGKTIELHCQVFHVFLSLRS